MSEEKVRNAHERVTMQRLGRDAALICDAALLRSSTVGLTGVVFAIYLSKAGLSTAAIGAVIGAGLVGATSATLLTGLYGDRLGRRVTLVTLGLATAAGYAALAMSEQLAVLMPIAFFGMVNAIGRDRSRAA